MQFVEKSNMNEAVKSKSNSEHYIWGNNCDGWHLLKSDELSVIQEIVPPGESEEMHYHNYAKQVFYILCGSATIIVENNAFNLNTGDSLHVPAGKIHKFINNSNANVEFIVISTPKSHGDRINANQTAV